MQTPWEDLIIPSIPSHLQVGVGEEKGEEVVEAVEAVEAEGVREENQLGWRHVSWMVEVDQLARKMGVGVVEEAEEGELGEEMTASQRNSGNCGLGM